MKKIVVIPAAVAVVSLSAYSGIWFFKTSQFKKQINEFVSKDSEHLSVGEIAISGFPLSQKIVVKDLKFTAPENGGIISFKSIEAQTGLFSSTYSVSLPEAINLSSSKENFNIKVELDSDTKIEIVTKGNQEISQLNYSSSGYKITDNLTRKVILSGKEKESKTEIYVDGDVIGYKHQDSGSQIFDEKDNVIFSAASSFADVSYVTDKDKKTTLKIDANVKDFEYFNLDYIYKKISADKNISDANLAASTLPSNAKPEGKLSKSSVTLKMSLELVENGDKMIDTLPADQMATIPPESKSMYQRKAAPYSVALDLNNFEFASNAYKIALNGKVNTYPEDVIPFPSGVLNMKIEHFDELVQLIVSESNRFSSGNPQLAKDQADDQAKISKVVAIIKELAAQNSQTIDSTLAFEIKRDKNDGFDTFINNISAMEVGTKLMEAFTPAPAAAPVQEPVVQNPKPVEKAKPVKKTKKQ